jgi:hypothetical protein
LITGHAAVGGILTPQHRRSLYSFFIFHNKYNVNNDHHKYQSLRSAVNACSSFFPFLPENTKLDSWLSILPGYDIVPVTIVVLSTRRMAMGFHIMVKNDY